MNIKKNILGISSTVFIIGLIAAILISSGLSTVIWTQLKLSKGRKVTRGRQEQLERLEQQEQPGLLEQLDLKDSKAIKETLEHLEHHTS